MSGSSGRFLLRIPKETHRQLSDEAARADLSLNQLVLGRILAAGKTTSPENIFLNALFQGLDGLAIVQYGSTVRGEGLKSSDLDWLVIVPSEKKISRQSYHLVSQLQKKFEHDPLIQKISVHLAHLPESLADLSNFWLEVGLEGVVLLEKNNFSRVLYEIKNQIAIGNYKRKQSGGQPYWVNLSGRHNAKQGID